MNEPNLFIHFCKEVWHKPDQRLLDKLDLDSYWLAVLATERDRQREIRTIP